MPVEQMSGEEFIRHCAQAMVDKKAENVVILDLRGISGFTDYFVIASGSSEPHLKAIGTSVRELSRLEGGRTPLNEDGFPASQWVVVDFGDVIVHVFHQERRTFYDLESLWKDARRIAF